VGGASSARRPRARALTASEPISIIAPVLPTRASPLALAVACLTLVGCSLGTRAAAPTASPTAAPVTAPTTPTPRPHVSSPTPIPAPNVIGRVTPPATPTLRAGATIRLSLALDGPPTAAHVGLFVARERGYFLDAGLESYFHVAGSRAAALAALSSERDQLGLVGGDDVLRARAQGTPIVAVLALDGRGSDGYGLVLATTESVRAESGLALKAFAAAAVRGYGDASRDPGIAVDTLDRAHSTVDRDAAGRDVAELLPFWRADGPLGLQSDVRWRDAHRRLVGQGQVAAELDPAAAFTNDLAIAAAPTATPAPSPTPRPTVVQPPPRPTPRPAEPAAPKPAAPSPTPSDAGPSPASPPPSTPPAAPGGGLPPTPSPAPPAPPPGQPPPPRTPTAAGATP
jgi:hypothetical protein